MDENENENENEPTLRQKEEADIEKAPLREDLDDSSHPVLPAEERVDPEADKTGERLADNNTPDLNISIPKPGSPEKEVEK